TISQQCSDTVPAGSVISQSPAGGEQVPPGSAVNLVISTGPCPVTVPDVVGMSQAEAESAITGAGLTVGTISQQCSDTVPAGSVISQSPAGGEQVPPGSAVNLVISTGPYHNADQNGDGQISLSELLRVIQFFNYGAYHCDSFGEDGYAPGPGDQSCHPHASDYNPSDWNISLSELLRLIQFFNSGGYHPCPEDPESEDGYCPGPGL
ncbi:MAG TPA: PASTA domain-containing protein, partial [Candidatus Hydrogenedens sp.]|nr:PASTA domain-containing protein [Candidatus Hydrogenedens sp.]